MPHLLDLASDLQTVLNKSIIGPLRVKMMLDPDGDNVDLSDFLDRASSVVISKKKSIQVIRSISLLSLTLDSLLHCVR